MGNKGAQHYGLDQAGTDIKDSIAGVTKTVRPAPSRASIRIESCS